MGSVIDSLSFTHVEGSRTEHEVVLYALSTCAFCKKGIDFLSDSGVDFKYIYLDELDIEVKREVKSELKSQFDNLVVFPVLVVDNKRALTGFTKDQWESALGLRQS
ncbi:MAG: glutaredoxin family protein [Alkalispirochaetaceae bacterium]